MAIQYNPAPSFKPAPAGAAVARCVRIIDLGTQIEEGFKGKGQRSVHKIRLGFELPFVKIVEGDYAGQPYVVYRMFTLSFHEKANFKHFIENWFASSIDSVEKQQSVLNNFPKFLGQVCQVTIMHSKDGQYANIASVSPFLGNKKEVPANFNELLYLELSKEGYKKEIFEKLTEKTQETIKLSPEWQALNGGPALPTPSSSPHDGPTEEDDVPF